MCSEDKWMQLEDIMLSEARFRKTKATCFLSLGKTDLKDKHIHMQAHMQKVFMIVALL
jgi:hypothetical protein